MSATEDDPHAGIRAGGSADPDQPGPGTGIAGSTGDLTAELQAAANQAIDGLQTLTNHTIDEGETVLVGLLKVAADTQTQVSDFTSSLMDGAKTAIVGAQGDVPALTGAAQAHANQAIDGLQGLVNHAFDAGESGVLGVLKVVDEVQTQLAKLFAQAYGHVQSQIEGPPKG